jgi:hypothetical protein
VLVELRYDVSAFELVNSTISASAIHVHAVTPPALVSIDKASTLNTSARGLEYRPKWMDDDSFYLGPSNRGSGGSDYCHGVTAFGHDEATHDEATHDKAMHDGKYGSVLHAFRTATRGGGVGAEAAAEGTNGGRGGWGGWRGASTAGASAAGAAPATSHCMTSVGTLSNQRYTMLCIVSVYSDTTTLHQRTLHQGPDQYPFLHSLLTLPYSLSYTLFLTLSFYTLFLTHSLMHSFAYTLSHTLTNTSHTLLSHFLSYTHTLFLI